MTKAGTEPTKLYREAASSVNTYSTGIHKDRVERPGCHRVPHLPGMVSAPGPSEEDGLDRFRSARTDPESIETESSCTIDRVESASNLYHSRAGIDEPGTAHFLCSIQQSARLLSVALPEP